MLGTVPAVADRKPGAAGSKVGGRGPSGGVAPGPALSPPGRHWGAAPVAECGSQRDPLSDYFYPPLLWVRVVFMSLAQEDKSVNPREV